jgi:hypothetical protein
LDCLQAPDAWILLPHSVEFSTSADGEIWHSVGRVDTTLYRDGERRVRALAVDVPGHPVRFVRVRARPRILPDWHAGAGQRAWVFADEIIVQEV